MPSPKPNKFRTHTCGELRPEHDGQDVVLSGWHHNFRDFGGIVFLVLRDHYGITQIFLDPESDITKKVRDLLPESVLRIEGTVRKRNEKDINKKMPTGEIEVVANAIEVLSEVAEPIPFPINEKGKIGEEVRLKYRFLDLRREEMQARLKKRADLVALIHTHMREYGFLEVPTPILSNSSPEGARDYLVPSRVHPGKFYALPQAPQQWKQLLMCSGVDRYYQVAACFRDEDARADRSPGEFYQLDLECAFAEPEDVFAPVEALMIRATEELSDKTVMTKPFPRLTYLESMRRFGSDKPDLRFGLELQDATEILAASDMKVYADIAGDGGAIMALVVPGVADKYSRKQLDAVNALAPDAGAFGMDFIPLKKDGPGGIAKKVGEASINKLRETLSATDGDLICLLADRKPLLAQKYLGAVRLHLGQELGLRDPKLAAWCWVTDFPMFEYNDDEQKWDFMHNPFSWPRGGMEALDTLDPSAIIGEQYDIACNGIELSSGAIRNHIPEVMYKAFSIVGYGPEEVDRRFGHMIRAFRYGAPPHGGIAPGVERLMMILDNVDNLREVVPFPKDQQVRDLLVGSPSEADPGQLKELHLLVAPEDKS